MKTIIVVDPIRSGKKIVEAATKTGFSVLSIMTLSINLLKELEEYVINTVKLIDVQIEKHVLYTSNSEEVLKYVNEFDMEIVAVIPATDPGIHLADFLGAYYNTIHNDFSTSICRIDKGEMRKSIDRQRVLQPRFTIINRHDKFQYSSDFPQVVKPPRSAGTNLVQVCKTAKEISQALSKIFLNKNIFDRYSDTAIIEKYVDGQEFAVNLFAYNGKQYLIDVIEYIKYSNNYGNDIYYSLRQHTSISSTLLEIVDYSKIIAKIIGVDYGPSHIEVKLTHEGPMLIEIGSRFPGVKIPELWAMGSNIDPYRLIVDTFLGIDPTSKLKFLNFSRKYRIEFCSMDNMIQSVSAIQGIEEISALDSYISHELVAKIGNKFGPTIDLATIPLYIKLMHEDATILNTDAEKCHTHFCIR